MKLIIVVLLIVLIFVVYSRCIEKKPVIAIPIPHPTPINESLGQFHFNGKPDPECYKKCALDRVACGAKCRASESGAALQLCLNGCETVAMGCREVCNMG